MNGLQRPSAPHSAPLTPEEQTDLTSVPMVSGANGTRRKFVNTHKQVLNLANYHFTSLSGNETIKMRAIETLRKYGIGTCGPPGFYGTIGASDFSQSSLLVMNGVALQTSTWTLNVT